MNEQESAGGGMAQRAKQEAAGTAGRAREAATEVAGTAVEQGRAVTGEAVAQAQRMTDEVRHRVSDEAQSQARRAAQALRQWADDLASMAEASKPDSPVRGMVARAADGGRRAAGYLDERGFDGAVEELQRFARRRPGVFLAGAALAGFAVGRIVKAAAGPSQAGGSESVSPDRGAQLGDRYAGQAPVGETYAGQAPVGDTYAGHAPVGEPVVGDARSLPGDLPTPDLETGTAGQRP